MADNTVPFDMKLEVVMLPVADLDRAKDFYMQKVSFHLDHDVQPGEGVGVIQLTPPGSGCSIVFGYGIGEISEVPPGMVKGLHLVVKDIVQARDELIKRGVDMGEIIEYPGGIKFSGFSDPDGNTWTLQEIPSGI